jgi:hypothetical protein
MIITPIHQGQNTIKPSKGDKLIDYVIKIDIIT